MNLMKPKKRQKLCYNCEGEVDLDVIVCPFCAADLRAEKPEMAKSAFSPSISSLKQLNTENSLYPPPYGQPQPQEEVSRAREAPVQEEVHPEQEGFEEKSLWAKLTESPVAALLLFTLGVQFFLLGILLVLFSDRGVMILKWDASLWFIYILTSLPLLLFGYRFLNKL